MNIHPTLLNELVNQHQQELRADARRWVRASKFSRRSRSQRPSG
jgi:hypothetical protein